MRGAMAQLNSILFKHLSDFYNVIIYSFKRQYPEFLFPGKTQYELGEPAIKIPKDKNVISIDSINLCSIPKNPITMRQRMITQLEHQAANMPWFMFKPTQQSIGYNPLSTSQWT